MRLLHKVFALGDVRDVEAFCRSVLDEQLRRSGTVLDEPDYEEALDYLIGECWLIHEQQWDPARGVPFAAYAAVLLRFRTVEWFRARFGRNGHRRAPTGVVSFSELEVDQLEQTLHALAGDCEADCGADLARVLADRSREALRADAAVRQVAATPKGVARLLAELRAEIQGQLEHAA